MFEIAKLFYDIALLKKAPQDVPASQILLRFIVFLYAITSFLMLSMNSNWYSAILQVFVELLLVYVFCKGILFWIAKPYRFQQTFIALVGTDTFINFCAFPALATLATPRGSALAFFVVVGLMLWHWVITGHILRHALSQPFLFGLGVSLLYLMTVYQIIGSLFTALNAA